MNLKLQEKENVKKVIDKLITKEVFNDSFIVLFGANDFSERALKYLREQGFEVSAIIDNGKSGGGRKILDIPISSPDEILSEFKENAVILIGSRYYYEMKQQLEKMGYRENKHIFRTINYSDKSILSKTYFDARIKEIIDGYKLYNKIIEKYGNLPLYVCPYKGTGDIYLIGIYLDAHLKKRGVDNYIITVIGNACANVGKMFNFKNMEVITQQQSDNLLGFLRVMNDKNVDIKILHYGGHYMYTNVVHLFGYYKKLTFLDLFRCTVFDIDNDAEIKLPKFDYDNKYIEKLFEENNLKKGKTVVLSPYSTSTPCEIGDVWINLANELKQQGYTVCTNSAGDKEPEIPGTVKLFYALKYSLPILEYAGYFIGLRSGFCDLVCTAECKKIVLNQYKDFGFGTLRNFFSFKEMGIADDVVELIYYENDSDTMITEILKNME